MRLQKTVLVGFIMVLFLTQLTMAQASTEDEQNNIEVYEAAAPGVVNITTISVERDFFFNIVPRQGAGSVSYTHLRAHETNDLISYAVFCL